MKRISVFILSCTILLIGCNPVASPPSTMPENTVTSLPAFTPEPPPTFTPTSTPFSDVSKITTLATFNAITAVTSSENVTDVWAVGNDGLIVAYQSSNGYFRHVDSPERADWYDVDFVSPNDGWIVGSGDVILHWNGEKWEVLKPSTVDPWRQYSYNLYNVAFSNANDGWAAGCVSSEGGEQILIYHWAGITWEKVSLPEELFFWVCIHDIAAISPSDVWMVGTGWDAGKEHGVALHWDGDHWESFSEGDSFAIHSISALSSDDIWAIGDDKDVAYTDSVWHWNGIEWSEKASLESANLIYARKPDNIFAVGERIWRWNGSTWTEIDLTNNIYPADANIMDLIEMPNGRSSDLWLLDSSGIIYKFGLYWLDFGS